MVPAFSHPLLDARLLRLDHRAMVAKGKAVARIDDVHFQCREPVKGLHQLRQGQYARLARWRGINHRRGGRDGSLGLCDHCQGCRYDRVLYINRVDCGCRRCTRRTTCTAEQRYHEEQGENGKIFHMHNSFWQQSPY